MISRPAAAKIDNPWVNSVLACLAGFKCIQVFKNAWLKVKQLEPRIFSFVSSNVVYRYYYFIDRL